MRIKHYNLSILLNNIKEGKKATIKVINNQPKFSKLIGKLN
tara:strand:+ start:3768 stop:3890 length:123 start_codon:yes stop_codon:yes gene_type:complete